MMELYRLLIPFSAVVRASRLVVAQFGEPYALAGVDGYSYAVATENLPTFDSPS